MTTDVFVRDKNGFTPLHHAVFKDDFAAVKQLLEAGADVNATTSRLFEGVFAQSAPLHIAAKVGNFEIARLLVEKGADLESKDEPCDSALNIAAWNGHTSFVELLAFLGAEVDVPNRYG
jgi:serine/threonine-protein kinase TNNI3K